MRATLLFGILLFCGIAFSEVIQEDPKDDAPVVNKEGKSEDDPQSESDVIDEDHLQKESDDTIDEDDDSKETSEDSESDIEQEQIVEDTALEDEENQDEEDSEVEDPKRHRPSRQCKAT